MTIGGNALSIAISQFGLRLLSHLVKQSPAKNLVVSPIGLFQLLSLFAFEADEAIRQEMRHSLHFPQLKDDVLHSMLRQLSSRVLAKGIETELIYATALWAGSEITSDAPFLHLAERWGIEIFAATEATTAKMQSWAHENTRGLISSSASRPLPDQATLMNAVYFRGKWESPFEKANTQHRLFYRMGQLPSSVPLMRRPETEAVHLYRCDNFDAARIPYLSDTGHEFALHVILPRRALLDSMTGKDYLSPFVSQFTLGDWDRCQENYAQAVVDLILPRFTFRQTHTLAPVLMEMGMRRVFTKSKTYIPLILPEIKSVNQEAYISLDEEGTVAAAITSMVMEIGPGSERERPRIEKFHANRPFLFCLSEETSGLVLFAGVIHSPTE